MVINQPVYSKQPSYDLALWAEKVEVGKSAGVTKFIREEYGIEGVRLIAFDWQSGKVYSLL